jgi:hypothetical protein
MDVFKISHVSFRVQLSSSLALFLCQALFLDRTGASTILPNICIAWSVVISTVEFAEASYNKCARLQSHRTPQYTAPHKQ